MRSASSRIKEIGAVLVAIILALGLGACRKAAEPEGTKADSKAGEPAAVGAAAATNQGNAPVLPAVTGATSAPVAAPIPVPTNASPAAVSTNSAARELVLQIAQLDMGGGALSPEQAQKLKLQFKQLVEQGAAAVPEIREFLKKNQDLALGAEAGRTVGFPTLRAGFLDALRQIGGPEALGASREVLLGTADPFEIALCARNVEAIAPGQHRQETVEVARQRLAEASEGRLAAKDVGPLFQVLQSYGDAQVAADLERAAARWNLYATLALAGLPGGQGVPTLAKLAVQPPAGTDGKVACQVLAQAAVQQPEAAAALVDLARKGQISALSWVRVVYGLGGAQYDYTRKLPENTFAAEGAPGMALQHSDQGNQNYCTVPFQAGAATDDQLSRRKAVLEQLLAANTNPLTAQALQRTLQQMQKKSATTP